MRRIDADALRKNVSEYLDSLYERENFGTHEEIDERIGRIRALEIIIDTIDEAQTIDETDQCVDSADHVAEWIVLKDMPFFMCMCSNCGSMFDSTICRNKFVLYCPRFGKRIKAVENDD